MSNKTPILVLSKELFPLPVLPNKYTNSPLLKAKFKFEITGTLPWYMVAFLNSMTDSFIIVVKI